MSRFFAFLALGAVAVVSSNARAALYGDNGPGHDTVPFSTTEASRKGGVENPAVGQNPGYTTAVIIGAIPSTFFSVAALALGPSKVATLHPWWSVVGAASGVLTVSSGVAFAVSNKHSPSLMAPYLITGLVTGLPAIGFAAYGWAAKAPLPSATVQVLTRNDVFLAPPTLTVMATPSGNVGVGISLLSGRF